MTRVVLRASIGHRSVATRTIERLSLGPDVKLVRARPKTDGFFGDYFRVSSRARQPAVVALGGSEGGISTVDVARALSSHGYPTLALAYFKEPGLPKQIARIPLEYFAAAVRWMRGRPEVDPRRVVVLGISAGTVPAMLAGMHFRDLVRGVVVYAPSGYVLPEVDRNTPPWTLRGHPLAYVRGRFSPLGEGPRAAMLHPEKVKGPVMMVSGGADRLLPASDFASRMWARLGGVYSRRTDVWLNYPYAGHGVGGVIPYLPSGTVFDTPDGKLDFGGTAEATADARADSWPKLLAFLRRLR